MGLLDDVNAQVDKTIGKPMTVTKKHDSTTTVPEAVDLGYSEGMIRPGVSGGFVSREDESYGSRNKALLGGAQA